MKYDCCPICDSYAIEYTGVHHQHYYEVFCHECYYHGASSWEPFIAPWQCTNIGSALRSYIQQYRQTNLSFKDVEYIKGLQS